MVSGRAPGVVIALLALEAVESTCLTAHLSSRISAMSSPLYLLDSLLGVGHHPGFPMWCLATWELAGFYRSATSTPTTEWSSAGCARPGAGRWERTPETKVESPASGDQPNLRGIDRLNLILINYLLRWMNELLYCRSTKA